MFEIKPIGIVKSCYRDKFGTPRQPGLVPESRAFLQFLPETQPEFSLEGLSEFTHLWVLFIFHKNNSARFHAKIHPPRLKGKSCGVFATRSPHRPNPIGLSLVEIESITRDGIWVRGMDLIDGTPFVDVKPYLPQIECASHARGGWSDSVTDSEIHIDWNPDALKAMKSSATDLHPRNDIQKLIENTLRLDPRPLVYKGYEGEESPYRESHAVRIYDLDVHFRFTSPTCINIFEIRVTCNSSNIDS